MAWDAAWKHISSQHYTPIRPSPDTYLSGDCALPSTESSQSDNDNNNSDYCPHSDCETYHGSKKSHDAYHKSDRCFRK